jgi:hypothetical protein
MARVLDFCAEHGVGAEIEVIPVEKINDADERCWPPTCGTGSSSTTRRWSEPGFGRTTPHRRNT